MKHFIAVVVCLLNCALPLAALTGSEFVTLASNMGAAERDQLVYDLITSGTMPRSMRTPVVITDSLADARGEMHQLTISVWPDVLAIGTDDDFVRMPMLPRTAQRIADFFDASLPTPKLSDLIHSHSAVRMQPHPMTPDSTMTTLAVFARQDSAVNAAFAAEPGTLVAGHKKDIVITNRISLMPDRVFIYGWHYPDGRPIQPLSGVHGINYVDYSHGVRLIDNKIQVDGRPATIGQILAHPVLYRLLSNEDSPMPHPRYFL